MKKNIRHGYSSGKVYPDFLSAYKEVKDGEFFIYLNGVIYPFKWNLTDEFHSPVVFFTPGRTIRGKSVPIFQRSKYFGFLEDYNCISCFDPTLFKDSEMNLAWFQGERGRFYALEVAKLWGEFVKEIQINPAKILYYGTSGGGILGFYLAKVTPKSTLYMSNVQTDIRNYDAKTLQKLVDVSFCGDFDYVKNAGETQNRFTINGHSGAFNLVYAQNKVDDFHYFNHYKKWREKTDLTYFESVKFIEYDDPISGHGPLSAESEVKIIRGILDQKNYESVFPNVDIENVFPKKKDEVSSKSFFLKHSAFPSREIIFPINWSQDPYKSKNWQHHLNSLRWLPSLEKKLQKDIVVDFYNYHLRDRKKNKYYNTRTGDHTTAIRIDVLKDLKKKFKIDNIVLVSLSNILEEDIKTLLSDHVYQNNNHGLMADVAIIKALRSEFSSNRLTLNKVFKRLGETLQKMYDGEGVCLEHSVSYQEYNLEIISEIKLLLPKDSRLNYIIDNIVIKSKEFLGFFLLNNGQYIPLGDSFRLPNKRILHKVYGHEDPKEALSPFSNMSGSFYSRAGYFSYRWPTKLTHLSLVSGWHSHVHKQNDELSIFLFHKNFIVFDDPGYTDFKTWEEIKKFKSERWHSNFWIENHEWSDVCDHPSGSDLKVLSTDFVSVVAKSARQRGFTLAREVVISQNKILISDSVEGIIKAVSKVRHQFLLSDVYALIEGQVVFLFSKVGNQKIVKVEVTGSGEWIVEESYRVNEDRRAVGHADLLVYMSSDKKTDFSVYLL
ncbi:hypothetical protein ELY33_14775 [Vreelandella andesensis]|uniref:Heparin-sulfate lyase N-terminal domain-containing protein n=1 Tax=Vreelandella andesensis TaxID=447567 RepID=A0A433KGP4_9GAMM|nr:hypothetical protein [Halomonas andesensis]RUR27852.1 hypothetical protein ELY33_14775 [Halomonas andesensis]